TSVWRVCERGGPGAAPGGRARSPAETVTKAVVYGVRQRVSRKVPPGRAGMLYSGVRAARVAGTEVARTDTVGVAQGESAGLWLRRPRVRNPSPPPFHPAARIPRRRLTRRMAECRQSVVERGRSPIPASADAEM